MITENNISEQIHIKYPVILVHGIASRDCNNSWGRIPQELKNHGVDIYYGRTKAWAKIKDNANIIKDTVNEIIKAKNCEKVNIIAHSKGGLEVRYMISELGMGEKVASLTTINTPHRGAPVVDLMIKVIPKKIFRFIGKRVDDSAKRKGDIDPDCASSTMELSTWECEKFNNKIKNNKNVYYQSFFSVIKKTPPIRYLIPMTITKIMSKDNNDGVVNAKSAMWENYHEINNVPDTCHDGVVDCGKLNRKNNMILLLYLNIIIGLAMKGM